MSMMLNQLPLELRALIFGQLSPRNLALASLVCRAWQPVVFPHLYHTMVISSGSSLEALAKRLSVKDVSDSLSVSIHLRGLKLRNYIEDEDIHHLDLIVPQLTHLSYLYWELDFMPTDFHWFSACRNLKSVHLLPNILSDLEPSQNDWMERLPQLLTFTNLTHFSLKSESLNIECKFEDEKWQPLTSLLQSSSNLESIILDITDLDQSLATYSPTVIVEPLGNHFVLPRLHTFHMLGDVDPNWFCFASEVTHPLRSFLIRQPSITNLAFGSPLEDVSGDGMDPLDLSNTIPCVKNLACPLFLFEAIVTSNLASQIESLAVSNPSLYDDEPFDPVVEALTEDALPKLRKLEIWAEMGEYSLESDVLEAFLMAAKGLEELEFQLDVQDRDEFLSALSWAGNLRRIKLSSRQISSTADPEGMLLQLAKTCPRLEIITTRSEAWKVVRKDDSGEPSRVTIDCCSF